VRRALTALVAALALSALVACGSDEPIEESNDVYSVTIPAGYEETGDVTKGLVEFQTENELDEELGGEVALELENVWTKEPEDRFATNITVATERVGGGMSLERYGRLSVGNVGAVGITVDGERERTTLGGEEAVAFELTQSAQDLDVRSRVVTAIRDGIAYSVTLTALQEHFDDELGPFEDALETWEWVG
jgi:hypothetical protein